MEHDLEPIHKVEAEAESQPTVDSQGAEPSVASLVGNQAVQRQLRAGAADGGSAPRGAARSLAAARSELPHRGVIQAAFGRHDVGSVRAGIGGAAAAAGRDIHATAYTVGDRIGFADQPDLHLAAHEAAHVVQQRAGVSLDGGMSRRGDLYERHADQVADAVVTGQSAEALLDATPARGGGSGAAAVIQRDEPSPERQRSSATGVSGGFNLLLDILAGRLAVSGFAAAGPDAVGIVAIPRWSLQAPVPESLSLWGHTAIYVRSGGRIVVVRGFNIQSMADLFRPAPGASGSGIFSRLLSALGGPGRVRSGQASVPAAITDDAAMFAKTGARAVEYPVAPQVARAAAGGQPAPGPAGSGTPPRYTASPAEFAGGPCVGSNCGLWAVRQVEGAVGGSVGRAGQGSVVDLGEGGAAAPNTARQGRIIQFINDLMRGRANAAPVPGATGEPVASGMPTASRLATWGGRGLMALAPVLEFIMNYRQDIPLAQNLARTGLVGSNVAAFPALYNPATSAFGMRGGARAGGVADLVVNLLNFGMQAAGAPEPLRSLTETGASLTPSSTMLAGGRSLVDFIYAGATEGTSGVERVHRGLQEGRGGGVMQGYAALGALLAGDNLDFMISPEARSGQYGIFVESGNYWGDVLSGDTSVTRDLKEIWNWVWE